jgi:MFS transporter, FSR family, fosmidomycin resistance protein
MPVGIMLAGLGLAVTGIAGSLPLILAAVAVSGCGVAAFTPMRPGWPIGWRRIRRPWR